jgi:hypothetical protein
MAAMGWRNSAKHWHEHEVASLLLAGLATPLVLSVHSVVSFDFAVGIIPGWHDDLPPTSSPAHLRRRRHGAHRTLRCGGLRPQDFITERHQEPGR